MGGLAHHLDHLLPRGADAEDGLGLLDQRVAHGGERDAVVVAADDLDDALRRKGVEGGDGGLGDGGDRVVVVAHAGGGLVDELEAVGQAGEVGEGGLGLVERDAEEGGGGEGALGVELVVAAGDAEVERAAVCYAVVDDAGAGGGGEGHRAFVFGAEDGEVVGALVADDVFFGLAVFGFGAVPLDVVAGDEGDECDVGGPAHVAEVVEHVAGELEDGDVGCVDAVEVGEE